MARRSRSTTVRRPIWDDAKKVLQNWCSCFMTSASISAEHIKHISETRPAGYLRRRMMGFSFLTRRRGPSPTSIPSSSTCWDSGAPTLSARNSGRLAFSVTKRPIAGDGGTAQQGLIAVPKRSAAARSRRAPASVEIVANVYDEGGEPVIQCNIRDHRTSGVSRSGQLWPTSRRGWRRRRRIGPRIFPGHAES